MFSEGIKTTGMNWANETCYGFWHELMMVNCFCGMVHRRKALALFPTGTIVRDPHHLESPTRREKDLNLRRT